MENRATADRRMGGGMKSNSIPLPLDCARLQHTSATYLCAQLGPRPPGLGRSQGAQHLVNLYRLRGHLFRRCWNWTCARALRLNRPSMTHFAARWRLTSGDIQGTTAWAGAGMPNYGASGLATGYFKQNTDWTASFFFSRRSGRRGRLSRTPAACTLCAVGL